MSIERAAAASLAERGLAAVVGVDIVATVREDSPLDGMGLTEADLVCVSDAVASAAAEGGAECVLTDFDVDGLVTVADLVTAIAALGQVQA
jgi:hypothetical protein